MRKRAGKSRHYRLRLDALEERSLLSAITAQSLGSPPSAVPAEKGPALTAPMSLETAPGWRDRVAHVISATEGPGAAGVSGAAAGSAPGEGAWPYSETAVGPQIVMTNVSGPKGYAVGDSGRGWLGGDSYWKSAGGSFSDAMGGPEHILAKSTETGAPLDGGLTFAVQRSGTSTDASAAGSALSLPSSMVFNVQTGMPDPSRGLPRALAKSAETGGPPGGLTVDAQLGEISTEAIVTGWGVPGYTSVNVQVGVQTFRLGPPVWAMLHGSTEPTIDDHPDPNSAHDLLTAPTADVEVQTYQPVVTAQNMLGACTVNAAPTGHDGRETPAATSVAAAGAGPALALRVGTTPGQDSGSAPGLELSGTRFVVPSPGVSNPVGESVVVVSGPAASTEQAAAGAANAGLADVPNSLAQAGGEAALVTDQTPSPHGLGLIDNVLPFDRDTVSAAIDRFFDRFEQSGAEVDEEREPAALTPPPGTILIAVAATEAARRHFKRKREEDAAARPRRRDVEGLGFEDSFGSSGPWSSRLS